MGERAPEGVMRPPFAAFVGDSFADNASNSVDTCGACVPQLSGRPGRLAAGDLLRWPSASGHRRSPGWLRHLSAGSLPALPGLASPPCLQTSRTPGLSFSRRHEMSHCPASFRCLDTRGGSFPNRATQWPRFPSTPLWTGVSSTSQFRHVARDQKRKILIWETHFAARTDGWSLLSLRNALCANF